jgi:hypothetical protein
MQIKHLPFLEFSATIPTMSAYKRTLFVNFILSMNKFVCDSNLIKFIEKVIDFKINILKLIFTYYF